MAKSSGITSATNYISAYSLMGLSMMLALLVTTPIQAKMYKWVDEKGVTHYTQQKPVTQDSNVIKAYGPGDSSQNTGQSRSHTKTDKPAKKTLSSQASLDTRRKKKCDYIRKNLGLLEQPLNMMTKRVDGKLVPINAAERNQLMVQYRNTIKQHCL